MCKEVTVGVSNTPIWIVRFDTEKQIRKVIWTKSEMSRDMIIPPKYSRRRAEHKAKQVKEPLDDKYSL